MRLCPVFADPVTICNMLANVGIFSLSYAVMPSFLVSVLFIDPYLIFNILVTTSTRLLRTSTLSLLAWLVVLWLYQQGCKAQLQGFLELCDKYIYNK